jgi:hypothetical protein
MALDVRMTQLGLLMEKVALEMNLQSYGEVGGAIVGGAGVRGANNDVLKALPHPSSEVATRQRCWGLGKSRRS